MHRTQTRTPVVDSKHRDEVPDEGGRGKRRPYDHQTVRGPLLWLQAITLAQGTPESAARTTTTSRRCREEESQGEDRRRWRWCAQSAK